MGARLAAVAAALLGVATVFGFAPFGLSALPVFTLAGLFFLWQRAPSPRAAAGTGFAFGVGLFGVGASWVYVALAQFGGMEGVLAGLATAGFCAYLALLPALAGWLTARLAPVDTAARLAAAAACWTLTEWLRSWLLSGFPWLSVGYAQTSAALAGFAPIGGVFLVGLAVAASAAGVAFAAQGLRHRRHSAVAAALACLLALWAAALGLRTIEWSRAAGDPIAVSLVQGNVPEDLKFDTAYREATLAAYAELVAQARGRLIVLPESALPMFADEVPVDYVARLRTAAQQHGGDLLVGLFFSSRARQARTRTITTTAWSASGRRPRRSTANDTWYRSARPFRRSRWSAGLSAACCTSRSPTRRPARPIRRPSKSPANGSPSTSATRTRLAAS